MTTLSEITNLWDRSLHLIERAINDQKSYNSFFSSSYIYDIKDNQIVIVVNTSLAVQLMRSKYIEIIKGALKEITGINYNIDFISSSDVGELNKDPIIKRKSNYFEGAHIRPEFTFDNFVVGTFNREASQAALVVAKNPGRMFNPLFLYSGSGLGKTHLLYAIGNYIKNEVNPNSKILYITGQEFVEEYLKFVRGEKESESLKEYVTSFDVLLIDDIQFLENKVNTQEAFFYIYDRLVKNGKQVVITSDRNPNELRNIENRLITRLTQGLVMNIKEPDENTCVAILEKKIEDSGLDITKFDDSVLRFFADKFSSNVRELEGALNRLIFHIQNIQNTDVITLDVAVKAISSLLEGKSLATQLSEQKIINIVADYYGLTPTQLTKGRRTAQIALARHIAMYLIRQNLDISLLKIGSMFGGMHHTTVMSGVQHVDNELKTNNQLKIAVSELQKRIKS